MKPTQEQIKGAIDPKYNRQESSNISRKLLDNKLNKLTEAQIKEFWEGYGVKPAYVRNHIGIAGFRYPDIDLNNLFKYAVPKARLCQKKPRNFHTLMLGWLGRIHRGEDPALALFWALDKARRIK